VVGALAFLELVHHLAVARGGLQHLAASGHLGIAAVEVERRSVAIALARSMYAWAAIRSPAEAPANVTWRVVCTASDAVFVAASSIASPRKRSSLARSSWARSSARSRSDLTRSRRNVKDGVSTNRMIERS
jgi:hypothetical protein